MIIQTFTLFLYTPLADFENYRNIMFFRVSICVLISVFIGILLVIDYSLWYLIFIQAILIPTFFNIGNVIYDS